MLGQSRLLSTIHSVQLVLDLGHHGLDAGVLQLGAELSHISFRIVHQAEADTRHIGVVHVGDVVQVHLDVGQIEHDLAVGIAGSDLIVTGIQRIDGIPIQFGVAQADIVVRPHQKLKSTPSEACSKPSGRTM